MDAVDSALLFFGLLAAFAGVFTFLVTRGDKETKKSRR